MESLFENLGLVRIYSTPYKPPATRVQHADTCWVMTYSHKTQSFIKNGGQQKCLDKALIVRNDLVRYKKKKID